VIQTRHRVFVPQLVRLAADRFDDADAHARSDRACRLTDDHLVAYGGAA
jgi:hypothetical protein